MNTTYELWDIETGNIVGDFSTADDALKVVQNLLDAYGPDYAGNLTLSEREGSNDARVIASGQQLVDPHGCPCGLRSLCLPVLFSWG